MNASGWSARLEGAREWLESVRAMIHGAAASLAGWLWQCRRDHPLPPRPAVVTAAWLAMGCLAARGIDPGPGRCPAVGWWTAATLLLAAWCCAVRTARGRTSALLLGGAIAACGAAWATCSFTLFPRDDLAWQLAETPVPVAVRGTVDRGFRELSPPGSGRGASGGGSRECIVRIEAWRDGSRWRPASGRAAVVVDGEAPPLGVGDRVRILGRATRPAAAVNPGEFDFRTRARSHRCLSTIRVASARGLRVLRPAGSFALWRWIDDLRSRGVSTLEAHLSPARAPLAAALLLGSRETLSREDADAFLATGTVHILSISGLHVGLLSLGLFRVLRMMMVPRGRALLAVALATGGYMLLVQAETPVLRATLLVWLSCLAAAIGRRSPAINALAVAAIVVLVLRPGDVLGAGPQLSFLSTAVLVGMAAALPSHRRPDDPIERLIERSRSPLERLLRTAAWHCWAGFVAGAAVWAVTLPLVAGRFHVVSLVGLLVNVIVAPLVALAMGWGFLCLVTAGISTTLAGFCGAACDGMLAAIAATVHWSARVPGGHWWVVGPPGWWVAGWYGVLLATLVWCRPEMLRRGRTWAAVAVAWSAVGVVAAGVEVVRGRPARLRAVVTAMGHGCGIVFTTPAGRTLVFDAGRMGAPGSAGRSMSAVLWSERTRTIDHLVISHADADHFNAVPALLKRFSVGEVVVTDALLDSDSLAVAEIVATIRATGVPLRSVMAGDSFAVDPVTRVRILHPPSADAVHSREGTDNESSVVMAVEAAGRRWLLTGDLEGPAVRRFVDTDPDSCDVLVAPHHGSATSLPPLVAAATTPRIVVVSGQEGRTWPLVRDAYAAAAATDVLVTGRSGAIAIDADAASLVVHRFSGGRWRRMP